MTPEEKKETARARAGEWYRRNKERARAAALVHYHANRDKIQAARAARRDANRAQYNLKAKDWRVSNPEKVKEVNWRQRGIQLTFAEFQAMKERQEHLCALCKGPPGRKGLCVDHHHATGRVRALLCSNCNSGIGKLKDSPELLEAAASYVRSHKESV